MLYYIILYYIIVYYNIKYNSKISIQFNNIRNIPNSSKRKTKEKIIK